MLLNLSLIKNLSQLQIGILRLFDIDLGVPGDLSHQSCSVFGVIFRWPLLWADIVYASLQNLYNFCMDGWSGNFHRFDEVTTASPSLKLPENCITVSCVLSLAFGRLKEARWAKRIQRRCSDYFFLAFIHVAVDVANLIH